MSLEAALPRGEWQYWCWRSTPKRVRRLVYSSRKDPLDQLAVYTFLLKQKVPALALEARIYESNAHTTLFIAKADTSGYVERLNTRHIVAQVLRDLLATCSPTKSIRIALSAKAQGQYLFANSKENPEKHVLDDSKLIKWWVSTLDLLFPDLKSPHGRLHIPGISDHETESYFPKTPSNHDWAPGDIYSEPNTWAVKCIPRFEDDPKTRFLGDIVTGKRAKQVNCAQFWLELADRQECNINARIGFIGVEAQGIIPRNNGPSSVPPLQFTSLGFDDVKKVKQALMGGDYSTLDAALASSATLEAHLPEPETIEGSWSPHTKITDTAGNDRPKPAVNMLNGSLVRKKKA